MEDAVRAARSAVRCAEDGFGPEHDCVAAACSELVELLLCGAENDDILEQYRQGQLEWHEAAAELRSRERGNRRALEEAEMLAYRVVKINASIHGTNSVTRPTSAAATVHVY